jgi:hypothetical protein
MELGKANCKCGQENVGWWVLSTLKGVFSIKNITRKIYYFRGGMACYGAVVGMLTCDRERERERERERGSISVFAFYNKLSKMWRQELFS